MARDPQAAVASPCISVCEILPASGLCAGCFRTLDEIAAWSVLDAAGRRAVLAALPARRAAHAGASTNAGPQPAAGTARPAPTTEGSDAAG